VPLRSQFHILLNCKISNLVARGWHFDFLLIPRRGWWWVSIWRRRALFLRRRGPFYWRRATFSQKNSFIWISALHVWISAPCIKFWHQVFDFGARYLDFGAKFSKTPLLIWRRGEVSGSLRPILTENTENWISRYLVVSPSWCRHFGCLGFLTGASTTNFGISVDFERVLTLFSATKNSAVICRARLLYEISHSFRSTIFLQQIFRTFSPQLKPSSRSSGCAFDMLGQWWHGANIWTVSIPDWNQHVCKNQYMCKISFLFLRWKQSTFFEDISLSLQLYYE
jgi:hypothetical protein